MELSSALRAVSTTVFAFSWSANILLMYLNCRQTKYDFGRYKQIMLCFAIFNMTYVTIEFVTEPVSVQYPFCLIKTISAPVS